MTLERSRAVAWTLVWMCVGYLGMALVYAVMQAPAPTVDASTKRLLDAWVQQDLANARTVQARMEAVQKLPEWKAYEDAVKVRRDAQAALDKQVSAVAPGVRLDFSTVPARLVPVNAAPAKESP